ncbi:MAG: insulinase family protein, partial [Streptococcaceae bacterium]|nr:insulinase family protein [Streptococcaceae bacterium]
AGVSSVELLQAETPQSVYDYYQEMLKTNAIDVIVSGDVEEQEVSALFQEFDFENRENKAEIFYSQPEVSKVKEKTENKEVAQSILQLAFSHSVPYGSDNYLALQLMNGLLGGFAHSKLFVNVREKASLAYSASSSFDSFTGVFVIAIGIDAKNYDEALSLTMEQVKAMQEGDFTQQELEDTKLMLKSGYLMSKDSQANLVEQAFIKSMLPEAFLEEQEFLSAVENTTKEDIVKVAQGLILQARYFMRGQLNEEE